MITGEQFFQLFSLWKKITDWVGDGDEDVGIDPDMERKGVKIDNEVGVAVIFEEEKQDAEDYQVCEEYSGDKDGGNNDDAHKTDADTSVDDSLLIGGETHDKAQNIQKNIISLHSIKWFLGPAVEVHSRSCHHCR